MKNFKEIPVSTAHRMINHGAVVLVSTRDEKGVYNIAPIAWTSPVSKDPAQILVVIGKRHKTFQNLEATGEMIVCVPHSSDADMVLRAGSVSGKEENKFETLGIEAFPGNKIDSLIPADSVGYMECRARKTVEMDKVHIYISDVVYAAVDESAFEERLLTEKEAGKTLHHLGSHVFCIPSDRVVIAGRES